MREFLFAISAIDMLIRSIREVRSSTCGRLAGRGGLAFSTGDGRISCRRGGATLNSFGSELGVGVGVASECAECLK